MGFFARQYEQFFEVAAQRKLRPTGIPADSRRGFAHSMMEYVVDTHLCLTGRVDDAFSDIREGLSGVGRKGGPGSLAWVSRTMEAEGLSSESCALEGDLLSFGERVEASTRPEELAYRAALKKFELASSEESLHYVSDFVQRGRAEVGSRSIEDLVRAASEFIGHKLTNRSEA
jgi:hypothetical protein